VALVKSLRMSVEGTVFGQGGAVGGGGVYKRGDNRAIILTLGKSLKATIISQRGQLAERNVRKRRLFLHAKSSLRLIGDDDIAGSWGPAKKAFQKMEKTTWSRTKFDLSPHRSPGGRGSFPGISEPGCR